MLMGVCWAAREGVDRLGAATSRRMSPCASARWRKLLVWSAEQEFPGLDDEGVVKAAVEAGGVEALQVGWSRVPGRCPPESVGGRQQWGD